MTFNEPKHITDAAHRIELHMSVHLTDSPYYSAKHVGGLDFNRYIEDVKVLATHYISIRDKPTLMYGNNYIPKETND